MTTKTFYRALRRSALMGTAMSAALATGAFAQNAPGGAAAPAASSTLTEVVVTAQKREQSLQDVPVAVTAIGQQQLQTNRITTIIDLNNLAPGLTVKPTPGGEGIPSFTMRGVTSYGVVPGSEREIAVYIDGIYLGSTRGSTFDIPDIAQVEVLRGPQGTLFGRNSTAGAVNFTTRNPKGRWGIEQDLSGGNYSEFRSRSRIDFPTWGPFSLAFTYLHEQRDGDIKNLGAGQTWTSPVQIGHGIPQTAVSPKTLGAKDLNATLVALRFKPTDHFDMMYKFDWSQNWYSPEGVAPVGVASLGPLPIAFLLAGQPNPPVFNQTGKRPSAVNNWFDVPALERNMGHSLTATWRVNDQLTLKSMTSYRDVMAYSTYEYSGLGGLVTTPFISAFLTHKPVGAPYELFGLNNIVFNRQYSEEVQANYNSKLVTVTAGAIYYHLDTLSGPPAGLFGNTINQSFPGGVQPLSVPPTDQSSNKTTSKAVYAQGEFHILPQLDFVAGDRITVDDKSGTLLNPAPCPCSFVYHGTRPSYTLGFNYKPSRDALLYVKYSTGYVSGGSVSVFSFKPETAKSWELGAKADFLQHRVRTNLALFDVDYTDLQSPQGGPTVGHPELSTVVIDLGTARVKGVEFEGSVLPMKGLTLSGSFGYAAYKLSSLTPLAAGIFVPAGTCPPGISPVSCFQNVGLPSWTAMLSGDYVTDPVFGDARVHVSIDGTFHSNYRTVQNFQLVNSSFNVLQFIPDTWLLNARVALEHIAVENGQVTVALWGKNLTNEDSIQFPNEIPLFASTSFLPSRTFGVDVNFKY